jgi:hypothetical protein
MPRTSIYRRAHARACASARTHARMLVHAHTLTHSHIHTHARTLSACVSCFRLRSRGTESEKSLLERLKKVLLSRVVLRQALSQSQAHIANCALFESGSRGHARIARAWVVRLLHSQRRAREGQCLRTSVVCASVFCLDSAALCRRIRSLLVSSRRSCHPPTP